MANYLKQHYPGANYKAAMKPVNLAFGYSAEFGCKVSGAKLILVLGHESYRAIKAAVDNVKLGNITAMLTKIRPAVVKSQDFKGDGR